MTRLFCNDRDGLYGGRSGSDDSNTLTTEVDLFMRPLARVVHRSGEGVEPIEVGCVCSRKTTGCHDAEIGRHLPTAIQLD